MILGILEHDRGTLESSTLQMLTLGRKLVETSWDFFEAVFVGQLNEVVKEQVKAYGVSKIHQIQHAQLNDYAPEAWAHSIVQLIQANQTTSVCAMGTDRGNELMAHIAAKMDLPMAANSTAVEVGDRYEVTRLRWGGSLLEKTSLVDECKLFTVATNVISAEVSASNDLSVAEFTPTLSETDFRVIISQRDENASGGVTLKNAPVVIGGGRGVGSEEGFGMLEELAELLGGAVGGSRVATNNGWRPHTDQVGLTGAHISPKLYIACGISGAIQHLVGCQGAKQVLVINKDSEAPFFAKADYGVVGDLHEVLPALIEAIKKHQ